MKARSPKRPALLLVSAIAVGVVIAFALTMLNRPAQVQPDAVKLSVPGGVTAPGGQLTLAPQLASPPASSVTPQAPAAPQLPESRQARIERLFHSSIPEERLAAFKALYRCMDAQRNAKGLIESMPSQTSLIYQDMNKACDGMTAQLLSQRNKLIEDLVKAKVPGAADEYINETPDGTPFILAMKDPNYQGWFVSVQYSHLESRLRA